MGKGYKGKNPRGAKSQTDEEAERAWREAERERRAERAQSRPNVGDMPSDDEEEEGEENAGGEEAKPKNITGIVHGAVGELPPADDEDEEDEEDEDEDDEPEYFKAAPKKKEVAEPVVRSAAEIAKDLEKLEIVKKRREEDRKKRIEAEGWDKYAPISETNRPPGYVPSDHPDAKP